MNRTVRQQLQVPIRVHFANLGASFWLFRVKITRPAPQEGPNEPVGSLGHRSRVGLGHETLLRKAPHCEGRPRSGLNYRTDQPDEDAWERFQRA